MHARRIEEASLSAWPALQYIFYDGWLLRFARGYTKRANSVNTLYGSSLDVDEKIDACEKIYRERGLPPIFRLNPFSHPADLDHVLEQRHYQRIDPTLVQYRSLDSNALEPARRCELHHENLDRWMDVFCRISGAEITDQQTHREMLDAIPSRRLLATLADEERVRACGVGVQENEYMGLFDLTTDPDFRNRGYGATLVAEMLRWGLAQGASHAYLQVMESNAPARHLYSRLGFSTIYPYWYRVLQS